MSRLNLDITKGNIIDYILYLLERQCRDKTLSTQSSQSCFKFVICVLAPYANRFGLHD